MQGAMHDGGNRGWSPWYTGTFIIEIWQRWHGARLRTPNNHFWWAKPSVRIGFNSMAMAMVASSIVLESFRRLSPSRLGGVFVHAGCIPRSKHVNSPKHVCRIWTHRFRDFLGTRLVFLWSSNRFGQSIEWPNSMRTSLAVSAYKSNEALLTNEELIWFVMKRTNGFRWKMLIWQWKRVLSSWSCLAWD